MVAFLSEHTQVSLNTAVLVAVAHAALCVAGVSCHDTCVARDHRCSLVAPSECGVAAQ